MRSIYFPTFASLLLIVVSLACKKDNNAMQEPEQDLVISTNMAALNTTPGSDFTFNLNVESLMPVSGVRIVSEVKAEADNQIYPQGTGIETTNKVATVNIRNLPRQKICVCTVSVTSKSKSTNTATTSFRVVYK